MTQTITERPTAESEARHFLTAVTRQVAQHGGLLTHAVDRAVVHAMLGAGSALLGDARGRQHLATASNLLRRHRRSDQADTVEIALAQTLLALLYGLLPGHGQQALAHLEEASELAEAHDGCDTATDGDALVQAALTGLVYAQLAARRTQ